MTRNQTYAVFCSLTFAALLAFFLQAFNPTLDVNKQPPIITGKGNSAHLFSDYKQWEQQLLNSGQSDTLHVALHNSKAFSSKRNSATGWVELNLLSGQIHASVAGLNHETSYQLRLTGYFKQQGQPVSKLIGTLQVLNNRLEISTSLDRFELHDFQLSRFEIIESTPVVTPNIVLTGAPGLYQRLFFSSKNWTVAGIGTQSDSAHADNIPQPFAFLLPKQAFAAFTQSDSEQYLEDLIAMGRELFKNETFDGNGRTCVTCHRLNNNHTIDPKFITGLPDDDPLFIAEQNPELSELENSKLLRQLGLIQVNIDGFDNPPVFRGVPHLLAMKTSITPEQEFEGQMVVHALGWSADGSTGDGSLRLFTIGAIVQHMTRSLDRIEGRDFRIPSDQELDALEAYMLSLGRSEDPDLDAMQFSSAIVQRGKELFHSKDIGTAQCKGCHFNGGANSSSSLQNGNRDTGVENMPENPARLIWQPAAVDGGFGTELGNNCGWNDQQTCYGNREFNMTTVIEAADTPPFFHNNAVNTIEEAVAFYNSDAFHNSPGANPADPNDPDSICERCIHMEPTQVVSVALFLRSLNAMENIRSSNQIDQQAIDLDSRFESERKELIELAIAETIDAIEVLEEGALIPYPESIRLLKEALKNQQYAQVQQRYSFLFRRTNARYRNFLERAMKLKSEARELMLSAS